MLPVGSVGTAPGGGLWPLSQKAGETFLRKYASKLYHGFYNVISILHSSPTSVQHEMEEKSIWRQESGRASNCGHKKWAVTDRLPALSDRLRRQGVHSEKPRQTWRNTVTNDLRELEPSWDYVAAAAEDRQRWLQRLVQCVTDAG